MRGLPCAAMLAVLGSLLAASACEPMRGGTDSAPSVVDTAPVVAPTGSSSASTSLEPRSLDALSLDDGRRLVEKHECNRCHDGTGLAAPPPDKHCVHCHEEIVAGRFDAPAAVLAKWKPRVDRLRFAPSLTRIGTLVAPSWVASYLQRPHDLRPALHLEMPRLDLDAREAEAIARYLGSLGTNGAAPAATVTSEGDADRGRRIFQSRQCGTCHAYAGSGMRAPSAASNGDAQHALAPDLAFARKRLRRARVVDWLRDPKAVTPDATMPKPDVTLAEAIDLVAFLFDAPLDVPREVPPPARLPLLERKVGYDEVAERVLHKICWHCHAQPDFARGDGGPGNTGGFGFAGRELDLSTYEAIASGYRSAAGDRVSLFSTAEGGEPMIVAVLRAREAEERGHSGTVRGMPLGLPPIAPEDIQLVASWVAQGHPR